MSDEKYNSRKSSVRKWKQEIGVGPPSTPTSVPENLQVFKLKHLQFRKNQFQKWTLNYMGNWILIILTAIFFVQ